MVAYKEIDFEDAIERDLLESGGYRKGEPGKFNAELALVPEDLVGFIQASQPELWAQLEKAHGAKLEQGLLEALCKELKRKGTLGVLRHGFKFFGTKLKAAAFRPAHGLNPDIEAQYQSNRLTVTRQVKFDPQSEKSVDMMISLNGLPVATLELKNALTSQTVRDAIRQYESRDQHLPLFRFKERTVVHFAVDTDEVYMATRLSGQVTRFLPFNRGDHGASGNPTVEGETYKTAYLWLEVLERHSLLDIVDRFVHLSREEKVVAGKTKVSEKLVFPRYHQLDVVRKLVAAARSEGTGNHYLIQHSAGSGKSNSIAWTAHQLQSLHDDQERKVFDSVVVITDRRILDRQLQDTIYEFEHKDGVVVKIDKNSSQLADALEKGTPIIITTLQKFPFVSDKVGALRGSRFAVIVDEAHSSQSGEAAKDLKAVLGVGNVDPALTVKDGADGPYGLDALQEAEEPTYEEKIAETMASRGKQPNLSFFAFTATPKAKTLEVFGSPDAEGKPRPFHVYSMRQAIEEGFILDVLQNYTTYKAYYKLVQKQASIDPDVEKKEATKALARFMSLHPHNIAQKTEVIVEHFRANVQRQLKGSAKAMVVTRSRLHAVRYKNAFDAYIKAQGYESLKALVAFSGTVKDDGAEYTEPSMNGFAEKELRAKFASPEYQVLLVANKYQTGFDQPLLCAMYVDKRLSGVQAVQTLSRLNRSHPGKDRTFVLDFANDWDDIRKAFQPFYEQTTVSENADPDQLQQLQYELDESRVWRASEIEAFAKIFYNLRKRPTKNEHSELYKYLDPARDRFKAIEDKEAREQWRGKLQAFVRLYSFLSQVIPWQDRELEVRYSYGRLLLKRLPRSERDTVVVDGEVDLHSYRLARIGEMDILLEQTGEGEVRGPTAVGTRTAEDEKVPLHEVIQILNDRFGLDLNERDQLFFDQVKADALDDPSLRERARANTLDNFLLSARDPITGSLVDQLPKNEALVAKFLNDSKLLETLISAIGTQLYRQIREGLPDEALHPESDAPPA